ncbi:GNAT family N-acetyltransferase [Microbacterium sp.]|uniref:GNAT family N-acetyltransferase n=1 Tax=Microbacterium sp. TaxID=51671 RepID=UPI003A85AD45
MTDTSLAERLGAVAAPRVPVHPDVAVWRSVSRTDIDGIHALTVAADRVDHPTWTTPREEIADQFALRHLDPERDTLVAVDRDGALLAVGVVLLHPARDDGRLTGFPSGTVHPDHRRRGIGAKLLEWERQRAREQFAEAAATLEGGGAVGKMTIFADEANVGLRALAESFGFGVDRWFTTMVRDLADAPVLPPVPDGFEVTAYTSARDLDTLRARNDAFRDHWGSRPTDAERWAQFVGSEFFRPDLSRLVLDDGRIVGFCLASVNEDDWETLGASNSCIDLIGVVRSHRGRGPAPLVVSHSLAAIRDARLAKAVLDVDTESPTRANTLYERLGFVATERSLALVERV